MFTIEYLLLRMNKIKNGSTTGRGNCFTFWFAYKTHLLNKSDNFPLGVEVFPEDSEYSDPLTLLVYTKQLKETLEDIGKNIWSHIYFNTAWKLSQSFSGPFFPAFGLNTERYGVSLPSISPYSVQMREKTDQKIFEYGHFSRTSSTDYFQGRTFPKNFRTIYMKTPWFKISCLLLKYTSSFFLAY